MNVCSSDLGVTVGREGREQESATHPFACPVQAGAVAAPSPWPPPAQLGQAQRAVGGIFVINIRVLSLQGSSGKYSIIGL